MSKLKIYHHELRHNEYEEFYLKSEADKVIAHHKYKRCLALHDYCLCELEFAFRDPCINRSVEGCVRWRKWANRWLELAEKFNPNNSTAQ